MMTVTASVLPDPKDYAVRSVVTLGETMLRLSPPHQQRIEQSQRFNYYVGGSESNVAVGLARLGLYAIWLSRLTDNLLGQHIARTLHAQGVDTSYVVWTPQDRVGLYFVEEAAPLRQNQVIYDRANSAFSQITPDDLPDDLFENSPPACLHITGITLALSDSARETALHTLRLASELGWLISFDTNFRSRLWDADTARRVCQPFMEQADIVFTPQRDAEALFGISSDTAGNPHHDMEALALDVPDTLLVMTRGSSGTAARQPDGQMITQPPFLVENPVGRIGGGDAFTAGFLYAYLVSEAAGKPDIVAALRWGAAAASLKYTIPGDMPLLDRSAVETLLSDQSSGHFR